ncbi:MAG TPA: radical SAM protein [bacterium]|nr:radical SAM protein [bacterium]HPN31403.1 radical SAM protein [bacterium]
MNEILFSEYFHYGKQINAVLIFPESYKFGSANLGHQTVYRLLNESEIVNCERFYIEPKSNRKLASVETGRQLSDFDFIAFSSSYELDVYKIIDLLKRLKLYPLSKEKLRRRPAIISGGALTFINPKLLQIYSDIVILGDFENIVLEFIQMLVQIKLGEDIDEIKSHYEFIFKGGDFSVKPNISETISAYSALVSEKSSFPNAFLVELARGCPYKCYFCNTGSSRGKLRFLDKELQNRLTQSMIQKKIKRIGLIGSASLLYPDIEKLLENLISNKIEFSFSSLNIADINETILKYIFEAGQQTITLAPEVGTEKMRQIIRKKYDSGKLLDIVEFAAKSGIPRLKLYFIYGFIEEELSDLTAIVELIFKIKKITSISQRPFNIIVSLNPFIPKPNTPAAGVEMQSKKILVSKLLFLKNELKNSGVRVEAMSVNEAILQYSLARGIY